MLMFPFDLNLSAEQKLKLFHKSFSVSSSQRCRPICCCMGGGCTVAVHAHLAVYFGVENAKIFYTGRYTVVFHVHTMSMLYIFIPILYPPAQLRVCVCTAFVDCMDVECVMDVCE